MKTRVLLDILFNGAFHDNLVHKNFLSPKYDFYSADWNFAQIEKKTRDFFAFQTFHLKSFFGGKTFHSFAKRILNTFDRTMEFTKLETSPLSHISLKGAGVANVTHNFFF